MDAPATEPRLGTDRHDTILVLALGALAAIERFQDALEATPAAPETAALEPADPAVVAALGVLAIGGSLRRWLEEAASLTPTPSSRVRTAPATSPEWLR